MLEQLIIRNFALFEEITVSFSQGLSVLTGETGAGKSLVVDALNFLCGSKADKDLIRAGNEKGYVEGLFQADGNQELLEALTELEIEPEEGSLLISRELNLSGRSISRINGLPVPLAILKRVTETLVDIHGQHEHQSLLQESRHLRQLDSFGDEKHLALIEQVKTDYEAYRQLNQQYQEARSSAAAREEQLDLLRMRDRELESAKLQPGEDEQLSQQRDLLRHAGKIKHAVESTYQALYEGGHAEESAWSLTSQGLKQMENILSLDPRFQEIHSRIQSACYELEELGHDLRSIADSTDTDGRRLEEVEERLDLIRKLSRKYGSSTDEMLLTWQGIKEQINQLESLDETLEALEKALEKNRSRYLASAQALSTARVKLARAFEGLIEKGLKELNMARSRFKVEVKPDPARFSQDGLDEVRMMIAPNLGEDFKPLAKIASGGELSRLMLAMKAITAEANAVPTMVFDEIDTGISGATAQVIAHKLWDIARFRQVICVSHLHQIAAMASSQMEVEKLEKDGRTNTAIRLLPDEDRVQAVAAMLGGTDTLARSGQQHARSLLEEAASYRKNNPLA